MMADDDDDNTPANAAAVPELDEAQREAAAVLHEAAGRREDAVVLPKRRLTSWRLAVLVYAYATGSPVRLELLLSKAGAPLAFALLALCPLLLALPQLLVTVELGAMMPSQAGAVVWVVRAFGPAAGLYYGWAMALLYAADIAVSASIAASLVQWLAYRGDPGGELWDVPIRVVLVVLAAAAGLLSLDQMSRVVVPTTVLLVALVFAGFVASASDFAGGMWTRAAPESVDWGTVLTVSLWQYSGFASASPVAGEAVTRGTLRRGLAASLGLMVATRVMAAFVILSQLRSPSDWQETPFLLTAFDRAAPSLGTVFAVVMVVSTIAGITTTIVGDSRNVWALARLGWAPRLLRTQRRATGSPYVAAVALAVAAIPFAVFPSAWLISALFTTATLALALVPLSCVRLRFAQPEQQRAYPVPGGWPGLLGATALQLTVLAAVLVVGVSASWTVAIAVIVINAALVGGIYRYEQPLMAELRRLALRLRAPLEEAQEVLMRASVSANFSLTDGPPSWMRSFARFRPLADAELPAPHPASVSGAALSGDADAVSSDGAAMVPVQGAAWPASGSAAMPTATFPTRSSRDDLLDDANGADEEAAVLVPATPVLSTGPPGQSIADALRMSMAAPPAVDGIPAAALLANEGLLAAASFASDTSAAA